MSSIKNSPISDSLIDLVDYDAPNEPDLTSGSQRSSVRTPTVGSPDFPFQQDSLKFHPIKYQNRDYLMNIHRSDFDFFHIYHHFLRPGSDTNDQNVKIFTDTKDFLKRTYPYYKFESTEEDYANAKIYGAPRHFPAINPDNYSTDSVGTDGNDNLFSAGESVDSKDGDDLVLFQKGSMNADDYRTIHLGKGYDHLQVNTGNTIIFPEEDCDYVVVRSGTHYIDTSVNNDIFIILGGNVTFIINPETCFDRFFTKMLYPGSVKFAINHNMVEGTTDEMRYNNLLTLYNRSNGEGHLTVNENSLELFFPFHSAFVLEGWKLSDMKREYFDFFDPGQGYPIGSSDDLSLS